MKEINDIINAYKQLDLAERKVALATVIYVEGSSYRRSGARMLVQDNGVWTGGISGGCLEGDALKKASYCMTQNKIKLVRYDTSQDDDKQIGVGLGCNGIIDVLISPIQENDQNSPIKTLESCVHDRHANCLVTVIKSSLDNLEEGKMYKYAPANNTFPKEVTSDISNALQNGRSLVKDYDGLSLFIEILLPTINVTLFGYSYDVYPLLKIGNELGWNMNVVCKTAKMTKPMRVLSHTVYPAGSKIDTDSFTAFVLMAHDYKTDKENLKMALYSNVPFVSMLGPLKRKNKAITELATEGFTFTSNQLSKLYNPAGLNIGSVTPEEIALAILAEIRAHFSNKNGLSLREKGGTIHDR